MNQQYFMEDRRKNRPISNTTKNKQNKIRARKNKSTIRNKHKQTRNDKHIPKIRNESRK